ncbi:hypothetical protein C1645_822041 [Glomus cerebriforme]|uniref:Uncharacterized protein n=1 Tax=Glomus cerebriforme TaxID=658196 RepID=A0A397SZ08_9GLOM|nr:hypothetical protein C1645_822041 [Glomus cerebriforme]
MFVRRLWILLVLLNITVAYVINHNSTNSTDIKYSVQDTRYPIHKVNIHVTPSLTYRITCIHYLDWTERSAYEGCWDYDWKNKIAAPEQDSPDWSVGYYICGKLLSIWGSTYTYCTDKVLWWDGWKEGKYCNNLLFYYGWVWDIYLKFSYNIVYGSEACSYE